MSRVTLSLDSLLGATRDSLGSRWRFHGRHELVSRARGREHALVILAGHKPHLWPHTLPRVARYVPAGMDVCLVTAGLEHRELRAFAAQHGWSYLSSENGHVSLAQNLAIRALPQARMLFKLDEDIFIGEGFFEDLLQGYHRVQAVSEFALGFCSPVLNVNGFSYVDFLRARDLEDAYRERFGEIRRAAEGIPVQQDGEAAAWLWERTLPFDETAAAFRRRTFAFSIVPHRFSIGAILFDRELWEGMGGYDRGWSSPGIGNDEYHLCASCLHSSRIMAVVHNVFAGHFSFGPQDQTMRSAFGDRLAQF